MLPSIWNENLWDEWFGFPELRDMDRTERKLYGRHADRLMKTDVREHEDQYEVDIDLPGFAKEEIKLTQTEYNIVAYLSENCGKMMTYAAIIKAVWREYPDDASIKKLQVNMANIRKKLKCVPGDNRYFVNELGVGYRMFAE